MHREEVARLRGLTRTQPAILLQVLHMDPDRHLRAGIGRADRRCHARQPSSREHVVGGDDAVRVLVPKVPRPQRLVSRESLRGPARQQRLRAYQVLVEVPVPQPVLDDAPARHHTETRVALRTSQGPRRDPVDTAHVPGEQRRHDVQPGALGGVGDRDQTFEHHGVDAIRPGLERLPEQEDADRVEPTVGDPSEVLGRLAFVEHRPPPHRGARGPVVDAEPERLGRRRRRHGPERSTIRR